MPANSLFEATASLGLDSVWIHPNRGYSVAYLHMRIVSCSRTVYFVAASVSSSTLGFIALDCIKDRFCVH